MDFLFVKYEKMKKKSNITNILRFLYKYIKNIDFLPNKDKILIYLKKCVNYSSMDLTKLQKIKIDQLKRRKQWRM